MSYREEAEPFDEDEEFPVEAKLDRHALPPLGTQERFEIEEEERRHAALMLEQRRQQREAYPFRPEIIDAAPPDRPSLVKRTALDKERIAERSQQKQLVEREYLRQHCPFQPQINPASADTAKKMFAAAQGRVEDRLLEYGHITKKNLDEFTREKQRQDRLMLKQAFKPRTNIKATSRTVDPQEAFFHRLARANEKAAVKKMQLENEDLNGCTFQPSIDPRSRAVAAAHRSGDVAERLFNEGVERLQRKGDRILDEDAAREAGKGSGEPRICETTDLWLAKSEKAEIFRKSFLERQQLLDEEHRLSLHKLRTEVTKEQTHGENVPRITSREIDESVNRLYEVTQYVSKDAQLKLRQRLQQEQCPFKPQLSFGTKYLTQKKIVADMPVYERLHSQRGSSRAQSEDAGQRTPFERVDERFPRRASGTESLTPSASGSKHQATKAPTAEAEPESERAAAKRKIVHDSDVRQFYERQLLHEEQKAQKIHQARVELSLKEGDECLFRPSLNASKIPQSARARPSSAEPRLHRDPWAAGTPSGPGLGSPLQTSRVNSSQGQPASGEKEYLSRMQRAQELQREKREKFESLGKGQPCNGPNYTVVVPFNLSGATKMIPRRTKNANNSTLQHDASTSNPTVPLSRLPDNVRSTVEKLFGPGATVSRHAPVN
jgi:hypothetical protein